MIKKLVFTFLLFIPTLLLTAQELNCKVQVIVPKLQTADPKIFKTLETSIFEFMNNRKWTNDIYSSHEKIDCSILINITNELSSDKFSAQMTVQASRTVFSSSYNTVTFNYIDKDCVFEYVEYQPLEFSETQYLTNLTSMLAFYANIILGLDYESFGSHGGSPYLQKAQEIVNNVPPNISSSEAPGWKAFESTRNRYWMIENLLNQKYDAFRNAYYEYHLQGFDIMYENLQLGRSKVFACLKMLETIHSEYPNSFLLALFFSAKADELVLLFTNAPPTDKTKAVQLLSKLDATNISKYTKILKN